MEEKHPSYPPVSQVIYILLLTFFLFSILTLVWSGHWGKWGLLLLETAIVIPPVIFLKMKRYDVKKTLRLKPVSLAALGVSFIIGIGLTLVTEEIDRLIQLFFPIPDFLWENLVQSMTFQTPTELAVLILAVVVVAALGEEMLFRGLLQGALEQSMDVTRAVMLTAFLFVAVHSNPWWLVEILILGVLMGVLAWKSGSIFPGVVVHGVNNGLALVLMNTDISSYEWLFYKNHVSPVWLVVGLGCVVGGFRLFYHLFEHKSIDFRV